MFLPPAGEGAAGALLEEVEEEDEIAERLLIIERGRSSHARAVRALLQLRVAPDRVQCLAFSMFRRIPSRETRVPVALRIWRMVSITPVERTGTSSVPQSFKSEYSMAVGSISKILTASGGLAASSSWAYGRLS